MVDVETETNQHLPKSAETETKSLTILCSNMGKFTTNTVYKLCKYYMNIDQNIVLILLKYCISIVQILRKCHISICQH